MKHRIAQFVVMLSLLLMGTFALPGVTHASVQKIAQPPPPPPHCYGEQCNGRPAFGICTFGAYPVRSVDIYAQRFVIARVSIVRSPQCYTYYARIESYVGPRFESVDIRRGFLFYGSGFHYAVATNSPMVGIRPFVTVYATGNFNYHSINYSASVFV